MEFGEAYTYIKEIITWALIPAGVLIWNLRGKIDKLVTKDELEGSYVKADDLKRTIKDCFAEFAKDSLELDSKYVTTHQLAHREKEMVKEISMRFAEETKRLEVIMVQSTQSLSSLPDKVTELDRTMIALDMTLSGLKNSLDFTANQLDEVGDIMDANKNELTEKIHKIEVNCARRNHA